jgi:UDP-N-acetylglucosamine 4,6-dehydratase/5-epimerase
MIVNKNIFITGGAGFLGKALIEKYYNNNNITIFSRDEAKHYYLKKRFPNIKCIIGDVRNFDLIKQSSKNHDIGIFAASLKQIEAVDQNVSEGVKVIIEGALNSRRIAEENNFEAACFISSDKSRAATTLYGAMKFVAGESFIVDAEKSTVRLSTAIYGNVLNSTGSIIPLIWDAIKNKYELTLYSPQMTRFMIDINNAIQLIEYGLETSGYNVIPNLKSFLIKDLFELYSEFFGLKYKIGTPRISEKLHELMISKEEINRTYFDVDKNTFFMHYKDQYCKDLSFENFSSDLVTVSKEELNNILKTYNYFKP